MPTLDIVQRVAERVDCGALLEGLTCVADGPRCAARTPVCEAGEGRCVGNQLYSCLEGVWVGVDCAQVPGATCDAAQKACVLQAAPASPG